MDDFISVVLTGRMLLVIDKDILFSSGFDVSIMG